MVSRLLSFLILIANIYRSKIRIRHCSLSKPFFKGKRPSASPRLQGTFSLCGVLRGNGEGLDPIALGACTELTVDGRLYLSPPRKSPSTCSREGARCPTPVFSQTVHNVCTTPPRQPPPKPVGRRHAPHRALLLGARGRNIASRRSRRPAPRRSRLPLPASVSAPPAMGVLFPRRQGCAGRLRRCRRVPGAHLRTRRMCARIAAFYVIVSRVRV